MLQAAKGISRKRVLIFIERYITSNSFPPTIREIQAGLGFATTSTVKYHLDELVADGKISREPGSPRSIALIGKHAPAPRYDVLERLVKTPTLSTYLSPVEDGVALDVAREFLEARASEWVAQGVMLYWTGDPHMGGYDAFEIFQYDTEAQTVLKLGYVMLVKAGNGVL